LYLTTRILLVDSKVKYFLKDDIVNYTCQLELDIQFMLASLREIGKQAKYVELAGLIFNES
jgi:hypothetical protein